MESLQHNKSNVCKLFAFVAIFIIILLSFASLASAETTCKRQECTITITLHIDFSGTDNATIQKWVQDIESIWNGYTFGACKCDVKVKVDWRNIGTASCQSNYSSTSTGRHCIHVSNATHVTIAGNTYRGIMWGTSKSGSSLAGYWGTSMNSPLPGVAGDIHDAAHEAGHMLGLEDEYNASTGTYAPNIMGRTWGNDSKPTQAQIDAIVANNCKGDNAKCPEYCCCGNDKIEKNVGEECEKTSDCTAGANPMCISCKCYYIDICGDGNVTGKEECDPNAEPEGCDEDEKCNPKTCLCEEVNLTVKITEPDDGEEIEQDEVVTVELDIESAKDIVKVEFYIDDELEEILEKEPWQWAFEAADYEPGEHDIKVIVYDEDDNEAEDEIEIEILE
ncbi:MAG: hypothetical protein K6T16_00055 [Candidatus Pacearchaeota archaeon]|nr:hypothetical protein [Candidatus Pacearchaeota archaeon]